MTTVADEPRDHDPSHDTTLLADLPPLVRAAAEAILPEEAEPQHVLDAVYEVSALRTLDLGTLIVHSDARWFATFSREPSPGVPIVEIRRWPGDTVVALYAVAPPGEAEGLLVLAGARFEPAPGARTAPLRGTIADETGERPALWIEREIEGAPSRLAALILVGDAGFGERGSRGLEIEAAHLVSRIEVRPAAWRHEEPLGRDVPLLLPSLDLPPGDRAEDLDPWQVGVGPGFTIGLPPGFRTYRLDLGVPPPEAIPGAVLWFRGRFRDEAGTLVAVGDGERYGYVAAVDPVTPEWSGGTLPPSGAPGASLAIPHPVAAPEMAQSTGAATATVERWREPRFEGDWIVFRLRYREHGVEIGLPVLGGRRSPSLIWIGQSFRPEGWSPAPPPVDPARRFGIDFARLTPVGRKATPWVEGHLTVPGLRAEVSSGLVPAASLRSNDGYPVRFQDDQGRPIATLRALAPTDVERWIAARTGVQELPKPARHRASRVLRDGRGGQLFVDASGNGFLFEIDPQAPAEIRGRWPIMMDSVRLGRR